MNNLIKLLNFYSTLREKLYVLIRWFICPFNTMEDNIPKKGLIIDVGCGEGVFTIYLAINSKDRKVLGIDIDSRRILSARKAARGMKNVSFEIRNATSIRSKINSIIISDSFHHFSKKDQINFLNICSKKLKSKGVLLIKEINNEDFIRSKLSRIWDFVLYPKDKINYWSKTQLINKLQELGFNVKTKKAALYFPGSTHIYICTKK